MWCEKEGIERARVKIACERGQDFFLVLISCKAEAPHVCFKFSERRSSRRSKKTRRVNLAASALSLLIIITECP